MTLTRKQALILLRLVGKHRWPEDEAKIWGLSAIPPEPLYIDKACRYRLTEAERILLDDRVAFVGGYEGLEAEGLLKTPGRQEGYGCFRKGFGDEEESTPYKLVCYSLDAAKLEAIAACPFDRAKRQ